MADDIASLPRMLWQDFKTGIDDKSYRYSLYAILLVGFVLRLLYVTQDMRFDESWTYLEYSSNSIVSILSRFDSTNNHILNSLFVAIVTKLFGDAPEIIRIPAFTFGMLMIPLVFVVAAQVYDRRAGLLSAALTAASSSLVEYSTNARGYTLLIDLTLLALYCACKLRSDDRFSLWMSFGVVGALGFYVSPIMLYSFGSVVLFLSASILFKDVAYPAPQALKRLALSFAVCAGLTVLFYLPGFLTSPVMDQSHLQPVPFGELWLQYLDPFVYSFFLWTRDIPVPVAGLLIAALAASVVFHGRLSRNRVPVVPCALIWPWIVGLFYHVAPITRSLLYILPLCFMAMSAAVVRALEWIARSGNMTKATCIVSVGLSLLLSSFVVARDTIPMSVQTGLVYGAKGAAHYVAEHYSMTDGICYSTSSVRSVEYYLYRDNVPYRWLERNAGDTVWVVCNHSEYDEKLDEVLLQNKLPLVYDILDSRTFGKTALYKVRLHGVRPRSVQ